MCPPPCCFLAETKQKDICSHSRCYQPEMLRGVLSVGKQKMLRFLIHTFGPISRHNWRTIRLSHLSGSGLSGIVHFTYCAHVFDIQARLPKVPSGMC